MNADMDSLTHSRLVGRSLNDVVRPITRSRADYDDLLQLVGDRRVVLIGESTHGTHDFYRERARITQRLIEELSFDGVLLEADWPDAARVNRFVTGRSDDADARAALADFRRFPSWMWRNQDVADFVAWLRIHNDRLPVEQRVGFYGLDLYSLRASMEAVIAYLDDVDPDEADLARLRYSCFDHVGAEGQAYGYAVARRPAADCEREVVDQLLALRQSAARPVTALGVDGSTEWFQAEQNALLVRDAEEYYRQMYRGNVSSWNLRDQHMARTLDAVLEHLDARPDRPRVRPSRVVVWAHNSHVGDARVTEMGSRGELNIGQLVRQRHGADALSIGMTTFHGEVTAASSWGGATRRLIVRPARSDSYEALLHRVDHAAFWFPTSDERIVDALPSRRLERAIGVIYRPDTERVSHYFDADVVGQFDVVVHIDHTTAVEPLDVNVLWRRGELPDTYPTGI